MAVATINPADIQAKWINLIGPAPLVEVLATRVMPGAATEEPKCVRNKITDTGAEALGLSAVAANVQRDRLFCRVRLPLVLGNNIGTAAIRRPREFPRNNVAEELAYFEWSDPPIRVHSETIDAQRGNHWPRAAFRARSVCIERLELIFPPQPIRR